MQDRTKFLRAASPFLVLTWLLGGALAGCGGTVLSEDSRGLLAEQSFALSYPEGSSKTVSSRRVVYKDASGSYRAAAGLEAFRAAGAPDSDLFAVRIAEVDAPGTRNALVVMSAGQKISSSGHMSGLTGQVSNWDDTCGDVSCPNVALDGRSLAMKLRSQGWLPPATTWMAVVNDNNFDHLFDSSKKQQFVNGFVHWLEEQVRPETRTIYLAGSSRGGCLVMLMAQQLRNNPSLDGIQLYVSSFDGVCKYTQGELGTTGDKINNPVRPSLTSYGGWATDLATQFPRRSGLHIFHIAGGEEVAPLTGIRAFSAYSGSSPPKTGSNLDWGWYKQNWVKWKHKEIGNPYTEPSSSERAQAVSETLDAQLTWLDGWL
jgi:hypothetical protein